MTWTDEQVRALKAELRGRSVETLALTAWAEARSQYVPHTGWIPNPLDAMKDVMNVVANRAHQPRSVGLSLADICLAHRQFSCWDALGGPENFAALLTRAQSLMMGELPTDKVKDCLEWAKRVVGGLAPDTLSDATHYYATWSPAPAWAQAPAHFVVERFGHRFYSHVRW